MAVPSPQRLRREAGSRAGPKDDSVELATSVLAEDEIMQVGSLHKNTQRPLADREGSTADAVVLECPASTEAESRLGNVLKHAFSASGHLPLRQLGLDIRDGQVVVRGTVPTYYLKQLAQHIIREVAPDCEIMNLVEVVGSACQGLLCTAIRRGRSSKSI